jgi:hypothetical protein
MASATLKYIMSVTDRLPLNEQLSLLEHVAKRLREAREGSQAPAVEEQPEQESLYGIWRDHFPPDVDIDAILYEIRHEWEKELDEVLES